MAQEWRSHPLLKHRFQPKFPDDLQVVVHDGGPRLTTHRPEAVWVRLHTTEAADLFVGTVLNQPSQLTSVKLGQDVRCLVTASAKFPVLVTAKYLAERADWNVIPCTKCGFGELFDAPSDLMRVIFPNNPPGAVTVMFTSFCPLCGGVQVIQHKSAEGAGASRRAFVKAIAGIHLDVPGDHVPPALPSRACALSRAIPSGAWSH